MNASKVTLRTVSDTALWFLFCFMLGTGLLIYYRLVPGFQGGHGLSLFGLDRHAWGSLHLLAGYLFLACLCLHLFLNYAFIKKVVAKGMTFRVLLLLGAGLAVIGVLMFAPTSFDASERGHGRDRQAVRGLP